MIHNLFSQSPNPLCSISPSPAMSDCCMIGWLWSNPKYVSEQVEGSSLRINFSANAHAWNLHVQVEGLEEVERAFVHVDYALRAEPEHKVRLNCSGPSCPDVCNHILVLAAAATNVDSASKDLITYCTAMSCMACRTSNSTFSHLVSTPCTITKHLTADLRLNSLLAH